MNGPARSPSASPVALLWDLDGTLLTTARAGVFALEAAAREVLGQEPDLSGLHTAGLTDAQVVAKVIEHCGGEPTEEVVTAMLRAYERHLPGCLSRRRGHVMPGVIEVLEDLAGNGDVTNLLLTGNTRAGARAKLRHYGLDRYVSDGAFCTGPGERDEIARAAGSLAAERSATPSPRLFVIGDTPHDVACGKAIGALTIAVATGPTPVEELRASEPWELLELLPAPAEFRALIGV